MTIQLYVYTVLYAVYIYLNYVYIQNTILVALDWVEIKDVYIDNMYVYIYVTWHIEYPPQYPVHADALYRTNNNLPCSVIYAVVYIIYLHIGYGYLYYWYAALL